MSPVSTPVTVIGVDAATQDSKIGLARGVWDRKCTQLEDVVLWSRQNRAADVIAGWLASATRPVLLSVDAPLGWPIALSRALKDHRAGDDVGAAPHEMFRRATDHFIKKTFRKTPLDVGADRIARTAHAALRLLGDLRRRTGAQIPLAWSPTALSDISVIEVYPAATLLSHGYASDGYKKPKDTSERSEIIQNLRSVVGLVKDVSRMETNADALDAAVCMLAGKDFLDGTAVPPPPHDEVRAQREGWIWVKRPPDKPTNLTESAPGCDGETPEARPNH